MQTIRCDDCGKVIGYKENEDLVLQCRNCSQKSGTQKLRRISLKDLWDMVKDNIRI